ncbi:MAG: collagen-like protein [Polyangiaceae bacterium]|nr:collagen-like protein [Polyangiaceae bacterium]
MLQHHHSRARVIAQQATMSCWSIIVLSSGAAACVVQSEPVSGLACWDKNGDGSQEPAEDVNGDGKWDSLDCAGAPGPIGAQGVAGPVGPTGPSGPIGSAGAPGQSGSEGPPGPTGPQGALGATGPAGPVGPTGPSGANGLLGATGPAGPVGPTGPAGTVTPPTSKAGYGLVINGGPNTAGNVDIDISPFDDSDILQLSINIFASITNDDSADQSKAGLYTLTGVLGHSFAGLETVTSSANTTVPNVFGANPSIAVVDPPSDIVSLGALSGLGSNLLSIEMPYMVGSTLRFPYAGVKTGGTGTGLSLYNIRISVSVIRLQ